MIGQDGGFQERPTTSNILLITPGRAHGRDRDPARRARRSQITLRAMLYNRGYGSIEYRSVEDVLTDGLHARAGAAAGCRCH